jgi:hypothetical protein
MDGHDMIVKMQLKKQHKEILLSYIRTAISSGAAVYMAGNHDYKAIGIAALSAILGPVMRWVNSNDPAFGRTKSSSES